MSLRVVGAGCGRTGTASLKFALERLLHAPCYHHDRSVPASRPLRDLAAGRHWAKRRIGMRSLRATPPRWIGRHPRSGRSSCGAYPGRARAPFASGCRGLVGERKPDDSFLPFRSHPAPPEWKAMIADMFRTRWGADLNDREASNCRLQRAQCAGSEYRAERTSAGVAGRGGLGADLRALGLPVPSEPFPRSNTREEFRARGKGVRRAGRRKDDIKIRRGEGHVLNGEQRRDALPDYQGGDDGTVRRDCWVEFVARKWRRWSMDSSNAMAACRVSSTS